MACNVEVNKWEKNYCWQRNSKVKDQFEKKNKFKKIKKIDVSKNRTGTLGANDIPYHTFSCHPLSHHTTLCPAKLGKLNREISIKTVCYR